VTLASLKKKLGLLEHTAKQAFATFMAALAQADGVVSPDEVKFLEKVYKALGVESTQVFSDIHAASAGHTPAPRTAAKGFRLDTARIAALEQDTARVLALLADITEETIQAPAPSVEAEPKRAAGLLGLDETHSALVRLMLSRPQWTRAELEDAASDLELMLDGALEQVNEACFDAHNIPLSEGEDPIEIHPDANGTYLSFFGWPWTLTASRATARGLVSSGYGFGLRSPISDFIWIASTTTVCRARSRLLIDGDGLHKHAVSWGCLGALAPRFSAAPAL
jgi:AcrR family transcriptional regulator